MALCAPVPCGCSITSSSLSITGNGAPWNIETYEGIATEVPDTRPGAGQRFDGMRVYTTDTNRLWLWRADLGTWELMYDPAPPWIAVFGGVGFQNSWVNFGGGRDEVAYRRIHDRVEVRGTAKNGTGGGATVFTLPVGFRPVGVIDVIGRDGTAGSSVAVFNIFNTGAVSVYFTDNTIISTNFWFSVI